MYLKRNLKKKLWIVGVDDEEFEFKTLKDAKAFLKNRYKKEAVKK